MARANTVQVGRSCHRAMRILTALSTPRNSLPQNTGSIMGRTGLRTFPQVGEGRLSLLVSPSMVTLPVFMKGYAPESSTPDQLVTFLFTQWSIEQFEEGYRIRSIGTGFWACAYNGEVVSIKQWLVGFKIKNWKVCHVGWILGVWPKYVQVVHSKSRWWKIQGSYIFSVWTNHAHWAWMPLIGTRTWARQCLDCQAEATWLPEDCEFLLSFGISTHTNNYLGKFSFSLSTPTALRPRFSLLRDLCSDLGI